MNSVLVFKFKKLIAVFALNLICGNVAFGDFVSVILEKLVYS